MRRNALVCLLCYWIRTSLAREFAKCEIVYELRVLGYAEHELKNLACLIEMFRSHRVTNELPFSSYDYDLFHEHEHYWCNDGALLGRGCNVPCADLVQDDITIAAACAKSLLDRRIGNPWYIWEIYCRGVKMPHHGC